MGWGWGVEGVRGVVSIGVLCPLACTRLPHDEGGGGGGG